MKANEDDSTLDEDSENDKSEDFVDPDSDEAVNAEADSETKTDDSDDDDAKESDDSVAKSISDGFDRVVDAIKTNDSKACDTGKVGSMARRTRRIATDDKGVAEEPKSSEEILDEVTDNGEDYENTVDELADGGKDPAQPVGDNEAGSTEEPVDKTDTTKEDKPKDETASTASVMHLVDTYIKAGVIREASRFQAIDRMSSMTKASVRNQMVAAKAVLKASAKRASVRKADLEGWEEDEPGLSYHEYPNDYLGYACDGSNGETAGFTMQNSEMFMVHQEDMTGTLEEIEAAADAWYEANKDSMAFASRHRAHRRLRRASVKKAYAGVWSSDKLGDKFTPEGTDPDSDEALYGYVYKNDDGVWCGDIDYPDGEGEYGVHKTFTNDDDAKAWVTEYFDKNGIIASRKARLDKNAALVKAARIIIAKYAKTAADEDESDEDEGKSDDAKEDSKDEDKSKDDSKDDSKDEGKSKAEANRKRVRAAVSRFAAARKHKVTVTTASATPKFDESADMSLI